MGKQEQNQTLSSIGANMLTQAQDAILKTNILADPAFNAVPHDNGGALTIANAYNLTVAWTVWKSSVTTGEIGDAWNGNDIDGMSSLNMQRLQLLLSSTTNGTYDMRRADRRAGFENPFGANANGASRVAMRAAWKRQATRCEKLFSTGTGSDADPAITTFEGIVTYSDIFRAMGW